MNPKSATTLTASEYNKLKKQRRKEQKLNFYRTNKDCLNQKRRRKEAKEVSESKWAVYKREKRVMVQERRSKNKIRQQKCRERKKAALSAQKSCNNFEFSNRMSKYRAIKQLKAALPKTPIKRVAVLQGYASSRSPSGNKLKSYLSSCKENCIGQKIVENLTGFIQSTKKRRSDEARNALTIVTASVSGENISSCKAKINLSSKLGIRPRRIAGGKRLRDKIIASEKFAFQFTSRKKRKDAISEESKKIIYDFWKSPQISRPTGNKKDMKRQRIAPKEYIEHTKQILEKTQTEAYIEFKDQHPDINVSQRAFESLKPFYVIPVRPKDRDTCCCRAHTEIRMVFKRCMEFRKKSLRHACTPDDTSAFPVFSSVNDLVRQTLCPKENDECYNDYNLDCLNRRCDKCGVSNLKLLDAETNCADNAEDVIWENYKYVLIKTKGDVSKRKLQLVKCSTKPGKMFEYLVHLLVSFPAHQFRANWQNKQYKSLTESLPLNHVVCLHDFSENYRCSDKAELQSSYFQKPEVSIHVSIIHRHSVLEYDGVESTIEEPNIITEQFFVISDDPQHDRYFTGYVQKEISQYLSNMNLNISVMHEFTDGCSGQYKSRNCMGDVSSGCKDLHYSTLIRNFYETSHAKGPQDAAGGFLKKQADMAVLRGKATIQNGIGFYEYASDNLTTPKSGIYKRRIFKYVKEISRIPTRKDFKSVNQNRKLHQIIALRSQPSKLLVRTISCYQCYECISGDIQNCKLKLKIGECTLIKMEQTKSITCPPENEEIADDLSLQNSISKGAVVAVLADDPAHDYYLLKVDKTPYSLDKISQDMWGCEFLPSANVVCGFYYDKIKSSPQKYKLLKNKLAIVYAVAVRYICAGIESKSKITISDDMHEEIIEVMKDSC